MTFSSNCLRISGWLIVFSGVLAFWSMKEDVIDCQVLLAGDTFSWIFSSQEVWVRKECPIRMWQCTISLPGLSRQLTPQSRIHWMSFIFWLPWPEIWLLLSYVLFYDRSEVSEGRDIDGIVVVVQRQKQRSYPKSALT